MTGEQQYYRGAGYYSLLCMVFPLVTLIGFHCFSYEAFFFFGTAGLFFGISGVRKGTCAGRICAVIGLLTFAWLALIFLDFSNAY